MTKAEIDAKVAEAEKWKAEDEQQRVRIEAKNSLENYAYSLRNLLNEETGKALTEADRNTIQTQVDRTLSWLDANQTATVEEFNHAKAELEKCVQPIMTAFHSGGATESTPSPRVEEVD